MPTRFRRITDEEQRFVARLLSRCGIEAAGYREQLEGAQVRSSCGCGCPSFEFVTDDENGAGFAPNQVLANAQATTHDGRDVGVILFVRDGRLRDVELFPYESNDPFPLPSPETLEPWAAGPRD